MNETYGKKWIRNDGKEEDKEEEETTDARKAGKSVETGKIKRVMMLASRLESR